MGKWEYKIVRLSDIRGPLIEPELNELGDDEWELVGEVTESTSGFLLGTTSSEILIFKRPK